jgi:hypothetical protein
MKRSIHPTHHTPRGIKAHGAPRRVVNIADNGNRQHFRQR